MTILETDRLVLRELTPNDAAFILELLNDPGWLRFIGDRGVRTLADAEAYICHGPVASYAKNGFGLWLVQRKVDAVPVGLCGLLKRDTLDDVDAGFALLGKFAGQGYATECATVTLEHARKTVGLKRVAAIISPGNTASARVLEKLGLRYERNIRLVPEAGELRYFAINF